MSEIMIFDSANMPVEAAARALKADPQTVRLLIQNNLVNWGKCFKRGNSKRYCYMISPKLFYEETGFVYREKGGELNG